MANEENKKVTIGDCVLVNLSIGEKSYECGINGEAICDLLNLGLQMVDTLVEFGCEDAEEYKEELVHIFLKNAHRETTPLPDVIKK